MYDYHLSPLEGGVEFKGWGKTPRLRTSKVTITEKIDGTNACVIVRGGELVGMQSRNRLIKPGDDNMGFAFWAHENRDKIAQIGDGYHYGEWAGPGIQKNPHMLDEKRFYLFNTARPPETLPEGIYQVPVLYEGEGGEKIVEDVMQCLWDAANNQEYIPEGIIIYHHNLKIRTKETFASRDGKWKS